MIKRLPTLWATAAAVLAVSAVVPQLAAGQGQAKMIVPGYENLQPLDANGNVVARRAIPRAADGKPDFTGVWAGPGFRHQVGRNDTDVPSLARLDKNLFPPFTPGGESFMYRPEIGVLEHDDPTALCLPNGIPRQIFSFYAQGWIQAPRHMVINYEYNHFVRVIPIGAPNRPHSDWDGENTWMGHSIGWWEGDTFVIDTIGLKEWWWEAAHEPTQWHSDKLHVVEKLTFTDPMTVRYDITFDDPVIFTRPFTQTFGMKLHPTWTVFEQVCEENNRCRAGVCEPSEEQPK
jgi:hypothetical protein